MHLHVTTTMGAGNKTENELPIDCIQSAIFGRGIVRRDDVGNARIYSIFYRDINIYNN